jgi:hypothetical protein
MMHVQPIQIHFVFWNQLGANITVIGPALGFYKPQKHNFTLAKHGHTGAADGEAGQQASSRRPHEPLPQQTGSG